MTLPDVSESHQTPSAVFETCSDPELLKRLGSCCATGVFRGKMLSNREDCSRATQSSARPRYQSPRMKSPYVAGITADSGLLLQPQSRSLVVPDCGDGFLCRIQFGRPHRHLS